MSKKLNPESEEQINIDRKEFRQYDNIVRVLDIVEHYPENFSNTIGNSFSTIVMSVERSQNITVYIAETVERLAKHGRITQPFKSDIPPSLKKRFVEIFSHYVEMYQYHKMLEEQNTDFQEINFIDKIRDMEKNHTKSLIYKDDENDLVREFARKIIKGE